MRKLVWILTFISMYIVSIGIRLGSLLTIAMDLNSNSTETFDLLINLLYNFLRK